jgi:hypothetical protein
MAVRVLTLIACLAVVVDVRAQGLPEQPISVGNGRFVFGAEVSATFGSEDPGFFNYTDYAFSALRNVRVSVSTRVRVTKRVQALAEVRVDHGDTVTPYAVFVRLRPWPERRFDVQLGRVPPTFGGFHHTVYAYQNLVIGQPLAYQYLLSLQPTSVPGTADDLLLMRGRGWLSSFPVGDPTPSPGVPVINSARFDTGVQVHGAVDAVEWTASVTTGSLSDPLVGDNNGRPQVAGRLVARPSTGLRLGASVARGRWLDAAVDSALPEGVSVSSARQAAFAVDAEYSYARWLVRGEYLRSSWSLPAVFEPAIDRPLVGESVIAEGRYRLWPGVSLAARGERLWFSTIQGTTVQRGWEADVRRLEIAASVSITRSVMTKVAWQRDRRDGGRVREASLVAAQAIYWF